MSTSPPMDMADIESNTRELYDNLRNIMKTTDQRRLVFTLTCKQNPKGKVVKTLLGKGKVVNVAAYVSPEKHMAYDVTFSVNIVDAITVLRRKLKDVETKEVTS